MRLFLQSSKGEQHKSPANLTIARMRVFSRFRQANPQSVVRLRKNLANAMACLMRAVMA